MYPDLGFEIGQNCAADRLTSDSSRVWFRRAGAQSSGGISDTENFTDSCSSYDNCDRDS